MTPRFGGRTIGVVAGVVLCALVVAGRAREKYHAAAELVPATSSATPGPTMTPRQARAVGVVRSFFTAYDRHDIVGTLALLNPGARYGDCDYGRHRLILLFTRGAIRQWLIARFAEHDRYLGLEDLVTHDTGAAGNVAVGGVPTRHNDSLDRLLKTGLVPSSVAAQKIIVGTGGRIIAAGLAGPGPEVCRAGVVPPGWKPKKERTLARAFLRAYNRHDVAGVLATIATDVSYTDCGVSQDSSGTVTLGGKAALGAWLRSRFAAGDRIEGPKLLFKSYLSEPPNDPRTIVVQGVRLTTSSTLQGASTPTIVRMVPNVAVTRIRTWQIANGCSLPPS